MNTTNPVNRICAVIPFYNEQNTIRNIIVNTLKYVDEVIAVNDGSNDSSVNELIGIERLTIIGNCTNLGKGYALSKGFIYSYDNKFDVTITLDADLQHDPTFIPAFLPLLDEFDIVIGNRLNDIKPMPYHRRFSNKITSALLSKKLNIKIEDSQCGYRAYKTRILPLIQTSSNGFEAESEIIVKAVRNNLRIGFVNIPAVYGNEKSKMKPVQAIIGFTKILLS